MHGTYWWKPLISNLSLFLGVASAAMMVLYTVVFAFKLAREDKWWQCLLECAFFGIAFTICIGACTLLIKELVING
jgi:hypothetical protein